MDYVPADAYRYTVAMSHEPDTVRQALELVSEGAAAPTSRSGARRYSGSVGGAREDGVPDAGNLGLQLFDIISRVPPCREGAADDPDARAKSIANEAAWLAAKVSGTLALPPGPLGLATILPDLLAVWKIQSAMVRDIAAAYGQRGALGREALVYCLFRHGSAALMRDVVMRLGDRYLVRGATTAALQALLRRVGLQVSQRVIGNAAARFVPLVGAAGMAAYAYYDTKRVAATAGEFFARQVEFVDLGEVAVGSRVAAGSAEALGPR